MEWFLHKFSHLNKSRKGVYMCRRPFRITLLILAFLTAMVAGWSANVRPVSFSTAGDPVKLQNNSNYGFNLDFHVNEYTLETISTKAGVFDQLSIEGYGYSGRIGEPKLPVLSKLIAVPLGAELSFDIYNQRLLDVSKADTRLEHRIIPAQRSMSKSEDPALAPFQVNEDVYGRNAWAGEELFKVEEVGLMRAVRVFRIEYQPVRYNPATGELQITVDAGIRVVFNHPDLAAQEELMAKTGSLEFDRLYQSILFNWQEESTRLNVNRYPTKMLILCPPTYTSTLQPFVDWKTQQGISVSVVTVGSTGTVANTTTAIKAYLQNLWDTATSANPAPTYLIIVGDTGSTDGTIIAPTGESGSHPTDLTYVRLNGTDYLPEIYYGRFSVSSTTELTNVINKSLTFEKTLMPDLSYLGKVVMIAGADASYAPTYGNGQINYGTTHYFNGSNGLTSNTYLYPASETSDAAVIANANEGRGYMNYTAHGSTTSWADPTFSVTDVNAMTNTNKYGVMVGNCCVTNQFTTSVCFGESIIRKANAGGVAYIGATNNSYWDEDYWWGIGYKTPIQAAAHDYNASTLGAYDAMFHTHGEDFSNWGTTLGEINVMGNSAVEQSTSSRKPYYWEIYEIMGDPSLMPYLGVPTVNTATFPSTILIGQTSITVTAAAYSRVALTMAGTIYGTGIVPAGGSLTLPITAFTTTGTASLVITAQNKVTRIESITIAPNSGAYLNVDSVNYGDSNNNVAEYNESGNLSVTFHNVGSVASNAATATLTCSTSGITITDGSEAVASIAAGGTLLKSNAFSFSVANNIANGLVASFTITTVSGTSSWVYNFTKVIAAPALGFGSITINDASGNNNGRLDPGESATITMPLNNTGGAASPSGTASLSCSTTGITITNGSASYAAIAAAGSASLSFTLSASSSMSVGTVASLVFSTTAGAYTASKTETTAIGLIIEDFETGNFNAYPWTLGSYPWVTTNSGAYAGTYCAKSATITHSQSSTMETTRVLTTAGTLSFWYKVSSESGYDYLKFYIDGVVQNSWSGTVDWTQASYTLSAGTRLLKWEYMKDGSVSSGSDCAWVDNIIFPASTSPSVYNPPRNLTATASHALVSLAWTAPASGTPTGYKIFRNSSLLTTTTGLSYTDLAVTDGTAYSYYLKATYSGGESDATDIVSATPNAVAPTNLTATGVDRSVNLSWTAATGRAIEGTNFNSMNADRDISSYRVYRNGTAVTTVTGTTYQDTGLVNGTTYSYYVTTLYTNPAGESAASNTVQATPNVVTETIIGTGTSSTGANDGAPINVWYQSLHGQAVYTAAELTAAGVTGPINITQIGINITTLPTKTMPNFVIRMKHTTATNVAAWVDNTNLTTVYSNASYLPTVTGWNMYTLSTPFLWNGTDNLLIDTAFGLIGSYASTGTVQYTTVTNGYRCGRSDTVDQTNLFTGTETSTYRPNLKLVVAPVVANPQISVNPTSLSFGSVAVNTTANQNFTLSNIGGGTLVGTISTPAGYSVDAAVRDTRNTIDFSLSPGQSRTYTLSFHPTSATSYNGNVVISSNSETSSTYNLAVTGSAYVPPTINVDAEQLSASLVVGEETSDFFTITNTGSQPLTYAISLSEVRNRGSFSVPLQAKDKDGRSIAGSTLTVNVSEYSPGTAQDWIFTATNTSTDSEWLKDIIVTFPAGVTVNSATNFVGGDGGDLTPDLTSGTGITITWHGETSSGWGVIYGNSDNAVATVNVSLPVSSAPITLNYTLSGDVYGSEPHVLSDVITIPAGVLPVEWFSADPISGTIAAGGNQAINGYFSAVGMAEGLYEAQLSISSNDPATPLKNVQILMEVAVGNHAPHINLPDSFSFEKNGSLVQDFSSYLSDADSDPLSLSVSGNSNVTVDITGSTVTFGAVQNWFGSEVLTFSVSDGSIIASDNVTIEVTPTNTPDWTPTVYPNNPATLYAVVTIDNIPAQLNDMVAAFVGNECRATGEIVLIDRSTAYTTLVVNLANPGETVSFKIYSYAQDTIYPVPDILPMDFGVVYGESTPVPLNGTATISIATPAISVTTVAGTPRLSWSSVNYANRYRILASSDPFGEYLPVGTTSDTYWVMDTASARMFYKVIAEQYLPTKGVK